MARIEFHLLLLLVFIFAIEFGHIGVSVDYVYGLVYILDELLKSFLSDENFIGFEKTHNIKRISVMPQYSLMILLSSDELFIAVLACDYAENASIVLNVLLKRHTDIFGFGLLYFLCVDYLYLSLTHFTRKQSF